jgi:hypothetical protein
MHRFTLRECKGTKGKGLLEEAKKKVAYAGLRLKLFTK